MDVKSIDCPSCGAPISETAGKFICQYCSREVLVESKKLAEISGTIERVETRTQEVIASGSEATQVELRKLQLTQELTMLQMQLSNIRSEKRNIHLAQKKTRQHKDQIRQIEIEESELVRRISQIQVVLYPPQNDNKTDQQGKNGSSYPAASTQQKIEGPKNSGVTYILAWFLGLFGVHRFYTGHVLLGFVYLFTAGLFILGYLFDLLMITFGSYKDKKGRLLSAPSKVGKIAMKVFTGLMIWISIARVGTGSGSPVPTEWIISSLIITMIIVNLDVLRTVLTGHKSRIDNQKGSLSQ